MGGNSTAISPHTQGHEKKLMNSAVKYFSKNKAFNFFLSSTNFCVVHVHFIFIKHQYLNFLVIHSTTLQMALIVAILFKWR